VRFEQAVGMSCAAARADRESSIRGAMKAGSSFMTRLRCRITARTLPVGERVRSQITCGGRSTLIIRDPPAGGQGAERPASEYDRLRSSTQSAQRRDQVSEHYYHAPDLAKFPEIGANCPDLARKFFEWYGAVFADGALSAREKALIALAVAHAVQCPYCIDAYSNDALEKGADLDMMTEAVHVAAAIRGGASLVHGVQMRGHAAKVNM
jgi:4-carboxymuconolactone decarboxylase